MRGRIVAGALCALVVLVGGAAAETAASAQGVVISEFRTRGPLGGNDEFIELYNATGADVDIGGWLVRGSNNAGTVSTRATIPSPTTLAAGCHYLLTNATPTTGYSGSVAGDRTFTTGITDDGGIALTLADNTVVDQVGMSTGSAYKEGTPLTSLTTNVDRGYERKPGGASGSGQDTDDNSADFALVTPNNPQNKLSTCVSTGSTNPSGVGAASPSTVTAGGSTLLTVTVTPGTGPASTGLAVSGDLTSINGSATQPFFDDATNGDVTAGDNVFSFSAAVPLATTPGAKTLPATVTDAQARSGSASIALTVTAPSTVGPGDVVVSEVYGGGGNSGATFKNDFIELYNRTGSAIDLAGWSVQYASAAGTSWQTTALSGTIAPGGYYLVQEGAGSGGDLPLPGPDATGGIAMAATAGKVALVSSTTALTGACPAGAAIIDFVGYGTTANCFEGAGPASAPSNTTSDSRANGGTTDTNNNSTDFTAGAPNPRGMTDPAPTVASTTPADSTSNVGTSSNVTINFSEPVSPTGSWFTINCANSGSHTAAVTSNAGSYQFTLNPDADFTSLESCTVSVIGAQVSDLDTFDPPDAMASNYVFSFTTADASVCGDPATFIHTVQGNGATSPLVGSAVSIEGVVVGDYQATGEFGGFYLQEQDSDADADPATSEGIFVFSTLTNVSVGDVVRVRGTVTEFGTPTSSLTELSSVNSVSICSTGNTVTPTTLTLPVSAMSDFERYEGMRVHFSQTLTANDTFTLGRFGEVRLAEGGRLYTPTAVTTPGAAALAREDLNQRRSFVLDDGDNQQNIDPTRYPTGGLSAANTLRSGYTVNNLDGVFDERFSTYRVQPVGPVSFTASNPRTPAPDAVGGNLRVASFNVLNFFNGNGLGGGFPTARGANTQQELDRQKAKEVSALQAMNADIVGLMEIENDASPNSAIEELVAGLNSAMGAGTYAFINTGVIGTDEIKVALIYKPASVTPVGAYKIITTATDPRFLDDKNRPSLAQTFRKNSNGEKLTVVVNHLKSKGSDCNDVGDPDTGDLQGNCNLTRQKAAAAISDWLATDPTGSGDPDFLLIGDMNSYTFEDPITTFINHGFTNLARQFGGLGAYSYVFDGESGYLDHALASSSLAAQATGATHWHINADEPIALDYNVEFKTSNQVNTFYDPGPYRASDHDPVVIGLTLNAPPTATFNAPSPVFAGLPFTLSLTSPNDPDAGDTLTYAFDCGSGYGAFSSTSSASCEAPTDLGSLSVGGKIRDNHGATTEYRATIDVTVTTDSLCELTRAYSSNGKVADQLCKELAKGNVDKFTKDVQKEAGRTLTQEEAATLVRLAGEL